jgi:8-oxo-dGTP diphosphatase
VKYTYEYPRPALTVDAVVFTLRAGDLAVLLIRRKKAPFKGKYALPGGFVDATESLAGAATRELAEETGVIDVTIHQLGAYGNPGRDPRGHTVSVAFYAFIVEQAHAVTAGDDASSAAWVSWAELESGRAELAFDHAQLVHDARMRLQRRLDEPCGHVGLELVPARFTLSELQHAYEAVLGRSFDKRNFRSRLLAQNLVEPAGAAQRSGRHRPAQLYRWRWHASASPVE